MLWVFIVTFVIFPGAFYDSSFDMLSSISDKDDRNSWYQIINLILFNVFDTIGRFMGGKFHLSGNTVIGLSVLRSVFIATTILIAYKASPAFIFQEDWFKILNMALFALSNGYVSTQCAIKAPSYVKEDQRESIGIFVGLFIALGIVSGSIMQIPIGGILPNNN